MGFSPFDLYLISDRHRIPGGDLVGAAAAALANVPQGRVALQLREKDLPTRDVLDLGRALATICERTGSPLFVNGRVDVALAIGATGVHLPANGLPAAAVRRQWPHLWVGCSTHGDPETGTGAQFITAGPVWNTPSKAAFGAPLGPEVLGNNGIPTYALGGVTVGRVAEALAAGAAGVACVRAIWEAEDPGQAVTAFLDRSEQARSEAS